MGNKDRGVEVPHEILDYSPDLPEVRQTLRQIETGTRPRLGASLGLPLRDP
jgi:hypothetical protein